MKLSPTIRASVLALAAVLAVAMALPAGAQAAAKPKYVFLFIGDGMGLPQVSATQYYYAAKQGKVGDDKLLMTAMPYQGITTTYSAESPITDSAAAGTAIACGVKTYNAGIGVDVHKKPYKNIAELAHQHGMKVGIVSSVSIDHATPASFYAHQESRKSYYEIGMELAKSGFEYFGGGGFLDPTGKKSKNPHGNVLDAVRAAGYDVVTDKASFEKLSAKNGKVVAINPRLPDDQAMPYGIDTRPGELTLADFTAKGIELLDNPKGFFMMVEGGKIDWACHANDATTTLRDVSAFNDAVAQAMYFMKKHPQETLIVVTADHETGGLTIGFAGTKYDSFFTVLDGQKISFTEFTDVVLKNYKDKAAGHYDFKDVEPLITENFGLKFAGDPKTDRTVLKPFEIAMLQEAFERSMKGETEKPKDEQTYLLYGSYDPLTIAVTHILDQKAGFGWTTYSHTGVPVATSAVGVEGQLFGGYYDNTDIFKKLAQAMGISATPVTLAAN
ncbi:Alkaline phosphatase [Desulfovibrio sp. X2]|uniref:alkaline phosphatase n=1 Tax=Desulfovibrio sp. X2 TaxID=941449 RepID=UPI000358AB82|nr:alkaline phosphatase [Desulfovibrio sp. X2]EPR39799.1 Alkaline phosphatase [Desulfovibrio sp. X2]